MNIFDSSMCRKGRLVCVFKEVEKVNGKWCLGQCMLGKSDHYNILPEHNSDGSVVHNDHSHHPRIHEFGPDVIWENLRSNSNGLTYDSKRRFPEDTFSDPRYIITPLDIPTSGDITSKTVLDVFGTSNLSLGTNSWTSHQVIGVPRKENCSIGVYGVINNKGIVNPKCLQSYSDIKDFINYTVLNEKKRNIFSITDSSADEVFDYLKDWFGIKTAIQISSYVKKIREGVYIDIKKVLAKLNIDEEHIGNFIRQTSLRSIKSIYPKYLNLDKLSNLYVYLDSCKHDEDVIRYRKCNLINYLLNYQGFKNGLPERRVDSFMFRQPIRYTPEINPSDRYWNVIPILRRAIKDRILKKGVILPDWVSESISNMKEKKKATVDDLDAVIFGLKNGKVMRPKVLKVESILSLDQEEASGIRYQVFKELIKAGIKWTTLELINSWEYFKISFRRNDPSIFWSFIKDVRVSSLQYANDMLAVEKEDTGSEIIGFSENRTFAKNLFLRMKDEHTWDISNEEYIPFDCSDTLEPEDEKIPMEKLLLSRIDKRKIDISKLAENEDDLFDLQDALETIDSHNHASVFGFVEASPDEELLDKEIDPIDGSTHYRFGEDKDSSD